MCCKEKAGKLHTLSSLLVSKVCVCFLLYTYKLPSGAHFRGFERSGAHMQMCERGTLYYDVEIIRLYTNARNPSELT